MWKFLQLTGRALNRQQVRFASQQAQVDLTRDNYQARHGTAILLIISGSVAAFYAYHTSLKVKELDEIKMNRTPLAERSRDPNMKYLDYKRDNLYLPINKA